MMHTMPPPLRALSGSVSAVGFASVGFGAALLAAPLAWQLGGALGASLGLGAALGAPWLASRLREQGSPLAFLGSLTASGALFGSLLLALFMAQRAAQDVLSPVPANGLNLVGGVLLAPLLGWIPGQIVGFLVALLFLGLSWGICEPWLYLERHPNLGGRGWLLQRAGAWILLLSLVSTALSFWLGAPLVSWLGLLAGLAMYRSGAARLARCEEWLAEVHAGKVPGWKIVPVAGAPQRIPRLLSFGGDPSQLLVHLSAPGDAPGPYRSLIETKPVARCESARRAARAAPSLVTPRAPLLR